MKRGPTPIYPKDATAFLLLLDVNPGYVYPMNIIPWLTSKSNNILEGGSGSGGMALFLSRAVGTKGQVHSYEIREEFSKVAQENSAAWGATNISFFVADMSKATLPTDYYDAVLLVHTSPLLTPLKDMMLPWLVLQNVIKSLKVGRRMGIILPNTVLYG